MLELEGSGAPRARVSEGFHLRTPPAHLFIVTYEVDLSYHGRSVYHWQRAPITYVKRPFVILYVLKASSPTPPTPRPPLRLSGGRVSNRGHANDSTAMLAHRANMHGCVILAATYSFLFHVAQIVYFLA